jgi:hypothetical protein
MQDASDHPTHEDQSVGHPRRRRASLIKLGTAAAAATAIVIALSGFGESSAPSRTAEVHWAACLRAHGVPTFPDPERDGAISSGRFDPTSAAFVAANQACTSVQPTGAIAVVPGRP